MKPDTLSADEAYAVMDRLPGGDLTKPGSIRPDECAKRYPEALLIVTRVAREYGYAIGVHGSRVRDLDLMAMPWVADAKPAIELVAALEAALGGFVTQRTSEGIEWPRRRPHGRMCWVIHLGAGPYIDLSVMPLAVDAGVPDD